MSKTRKVETDRFKAVADDGEVVTIIEITTETGFTPSSTGITEWLETIKEYRVAAGGFANQISATEFELVSNDKIVRRA